MPHGVAGPGLADPTDRSGPSTQGPVSANSPGAGGNDEERRRRSVSVGRTSGNNPFQDRFGSQNFQGTQQFQDILQMIEQRRAAAFANVQGQQTRQPLAPLQLAPVPPAALPPQAAPQAQAQAQAQAPQTNPLIMAFLQSLMGGQGQAAFATPQPFGGFQPVTSLGQLIAGG